jgi:hypothetical protein
MFRNHQFRHHSCDQYTDRFGRILGELQDKSGYSALWLLSKVTVLAAAPSHPHRTMGGSSAGSMAPLPATTEAKMPLPSSAHPSTPAWSYPSHPHRTMGGSSAGSMAPLPATTEAATPLPSLARPSTPARSYPFPPTPNQGGDSQRVDGTLACYHRGGNAIAKLGSSFIASLVYSLSTHHNRRGDYCG